MKMYYYLSTKRMNSKGLCPVYCRISYSHTQRTDISTAIFIHPKYWDSQKCFIKEELKYENNVLNIFTQRANQILLEAKISGENSTYTIARKIKGEKKKVYTKLSQILNEFFDHHKPSQLVRSRITKSIFNFEKYIKAPIQSITMTTAPQYEKVLALKCSSSEYIRKQQGYIKRVFEYATLMQYIPCNPYRLYQLPKVKAKEKIHLTIDQLKQLDKKKFQSERLDYTKKLFLLQCYTGFSYIDLKNFEMDQVKTIDGQKYIVSSRQKTGVKFHIPLLSVTEKLLKEVDDREVLSNQKYNSYLKEISAIMNWNMALTTHVGRKTFAQLMIDKGVSWEAVASMLGHSKTAVTEKHYATLGIERIKTEMAKIAA